MNWEVITAVPSSSALAGALVWAALWVVPGAAWAWALRRGDGRPEAGACTRTLIAGLILNLVVILGLGAAGRYTVAWELACLGLVTVAGGCLGRRRLAADVKGTVGAALLLVVGAEIILMLPHRGEWILGGWDPGVYIHQGILLERRGSLVPEPDPLFEALQPDEVALFTRPEYGSWMALPTVPLDPVQRKFEPFFPHGFPAWIARVYRCMGLRGALRANHFAAWLALLLMAPAARSLGLSRRAAGFATAALAAHPVFIHHTAFPTSELLQLALISGMAVLWAHRRAAGPSLGLAALMGLSVVVRPSFLPLGALLVAVAALDEASDPKRRAVRWRRLVQIGLLAAGAGFVIRWNGPLLTRWGPTTTLLGVGFAVVAAGGLGIDVVASLSARVRRLAAQPSLSGLLIAAAMVTGLAALAAAAAGRSDAATAARAWASGAAVYAGPSFLAAALLGWWIIGVRRDADERPLRGWVAYLLFCTAAAVAAPQITVWWPWASRRLLEAALPAMVLGIGAVIDRVGAVWPSPRAHLRPVALALIFGAVVMPAARRTWAAARATEYDGATAALAPVARLLGPRDVVVADHYWWGAPLRFLADVPVVNGELFWTAEDEGEQQRLAMDVLARLHREGWRIRLLTSTRKGLDVYPRPWAAVRLDVETEPWTARELLQHPRAREYKMRERSRLFRLYSWQPDDS